MALKPDRKELDTDIHFFCNTTVEKGELLVFDTGGSGVSVDDASAVVDRSPSNISGTYPAGVVLNDVVNIDLTRQHLNMAKDEVQLGSKVTLLTRGEITTDLIDTGSAGVPTIGAPAYYGSGAITSGGTGRSWFTASSPYSSTDDDASTTAGYRVGTFRSTKNSDGYAKISINIS